MQTSLYGRFNRVLDRVGILSRRLSHLPSVLRPVERIGIVMLLVVIAISSVVLAGQGGARPAFGGTFTEGYVGQPRYINPILASSDIDSSISRLIYSGLTRVDANGAIQPDLASSYEITDNTKTYSFTLRRDAVWHDGKPFGARDVAYTIDLIKDTATNSPFLNAWKDVSYETPQDDKIILHLKESSSAFLWQTTVGMVPSHIDKKALNTSFIGTGMYKYSKVRMRSGKIESLVLVRNAKWYGAHPPYINAVELWFYGSDQEAQKALESQKILAVKGVMSDEKRITVHAIDLAEESTLFLNTGSAVLSDPGVRKKILTTPDVFNPPLTLSIVADATLVSSDQFKALLEQWQNRNIQVTVTEQSLDTIKKIVLPQRTYDGLLVVREIGPQVDQYAHWHSSQADGSGLNFSRVKNADLDKMVIDSRKVTDQSSRTDLNDKITALLDSLAPYVVLSQTRIGYGLSKTVHPTFSSYNVSYADRYALFDQWYIKTRR